MRVFKRPGSSYYYYDFDLDGKTHVKSTRLKKERTRWTTPPPTG